MKRIAILLAVLFGLVWLGSTFGPRESPVPSAPSANALATATPAEENESDYQLSAAEKKARQEEWFGAEAVVAGKRAVRSSLTDPNSAQFRNVYANYTEEFDLVACGQVNSRNRLGGYTGFKRFVSNGRSAILEGRDDIAEAWPKACL